MIINIYPLDTLFFRDGLNFDAGDFTRASCIFPPYPPTIYGAVRSLLISQLGINTYEIDKAPYGLGGDIENCELKINCYTLSNDASLLFPSPITLAATRNKRYAFFTPKEEKNLCPVIFEKDFESVDSYLNLHDTKNILKKAIRKEYKLNLANNPYYKSFEKVGIAIDRKTGTAEEHKIYTYTNYQLRKDIFITIFLDLPDELKDKIKQFQKGFTKFGGEMRPIYYEFKNDDVNFLKDDAEEIKKIILNEKRFFLWLITPAVFQNGSIPDFIELDSNKMEGTIKLREKEIRLKLFSWQVGKPIHIGGFDIKTRIPKIMYKAVPSGSIYFFKILNEEVSSGMIDEIFNHFHLKPLDSKVPNIKKQGFGCTLIGGF